MLRRLAAAVFMSCLLLPAGSASGSALDVIRDCNRNGRLTKDYTQKEYREALASVPADQTQYTDCHNIIRRAQLGRRGTTEANAGNPFAGATPEEVVQAQADIESFKTKEVGGAKRRVGRSTVTPGSLAFRRVSAATSELPTPLLVPLALIALGTLGLAGQTLYSRRHGRRPGA